MGKARGYGPNIFWLAVEVAILTNYRERIAQLCDRILRPKQILHDARLTEMDGNMHTTSTKELLL